MKALEEHRRERLISHMRQQTAALVAVTAGIKSGWSDLPYDIQRAIIEYSSSINEYLDYQPSVSVWGRANTLFATVRDLLSGDAPRMRFTIALTEFNRAVDSAVNHDEAIWRRIEIERSSDKAKEDLEAARQEMAGGKLITYSAEDFQSRFKSA